MSDFSLDVTGCTAASLVLGIVAQCGPSGMGPLKQPPPLCCRLRKRVPRGQALPKFKTEKQQILETSDLDVAASGQSRTSVLAEQAAGQELAGLAHSRQEEKHAPKHKDEGEEGAEEDGKSGCALHVVCIYGGVALQCRVGGAQLGG